MAGYARLSNGFWQDKDILKLRRMNPSAALLYVMAISWCSDHASDGIIADDELLYVLNASDGDVADLVASGLLLRGSDEGCYMIRNYLKYQNSSRQIDESRERERVKKRRQREARQDIANVPDVSPKDDANVPDVSPKDDANVPDVSPKDDANVPDVSLGDIASVPDTSFNQEPRTKKIYLLTPLPPTKRISTGCSTASRASTRRTASTGKPAGRACSSRSTGRGSPRPQETTTRPRSSSPAPEPTARRPNPGTSRPSAGSSRASSTRANGSDNRRRRSPGRRREAWNGRRRADRRKTSKRTWPAHGRT